MDVLVTSQTPGPHTKPESLSLSCWLSWGGSQLNSIINAPASKQTKCPWKSTRSSAQATWVSAPDCGEGVSCHGGSRVSIWLRCGTHRQPVGHYFWVCLGEISIWMDKLDKEGHRSSSPMGVGITSALRARWNKKGKEGYVCFLGYETLKSTTNCPRFVSLVLDWMTPSGLVVLQFANGW